MPERIRLRRTKAWRKPEGAIVVARPSNWGNPFSIAGARDAGGSGTDVELRALCVSNFRAWLRGDFDMRHVHPHRRQWMLDHLDDLAGHDLACWCPLDQPCHADILLELANRPESITETTDVADGLRGTDAGSDDRFDADGAP